MSALSVRIGMKYMRGNTRFYVIDVIVGEDGIKDIVLEDNGHVVITVGIDDFKRDFSRC